MFRFRSQLFLAALTAVPSLLMLAPSGPVARFRAEQKVSGSSGAAHVRVGIDMLEDQNFEPLRGKRVGLVTNQTGVDSRGRRTIDVLTSAPDVKLVALFSPEHGINAKAEGSVANSTDAATGLRIYSLYGDVRRPTEDMLRNIDVLVFDIQDAGVRFYTYITTMAYCMEAAKAYGISFVLLDRPNPLGGQVIEGPTLDAGRTSFTGYYPMPVRYAMTLGELAQMFNSVNNIGADVQVVPMEGWRRSETYDQTGLPWIPPSPNLRTVDAVFIYPGIEILQEEGLSVGRGTDTPFELLGSPSIDGHKLAAVLNRRKIPGVHFAPATFTPTEGPNEKKVCHGIAISVSDRAIFPSMRTGLEIARVLLEMHDLPSPLRGMSLLGSQSTLDRLNQGDAPAEIVAGWADDLEKFRQIRARYLLYH
jgi:uncharacterized protein YbbC (DUF1343 family)